jgi:hypothetical protein
MTAQHTQGPWSYLPGDGLAWPSVQRATEGGFVVVGSSREREEADAKLIAAAPDLLEALQELLAAERANSLEIFGRDTGGHPLNAAGVARKKARAAIAKANGETK